MSDETTTETLTEPPDPTPPINVVDNLMSMHIHERESMFDVLTNNKELFDKMIPGIMDAITDPTQEHDHPLFRHYKEWNRTPK